MSLSATLWMFRNVLEHWIRLIDTAHSVMFQIWHASTHPALWCSKTCNVIFSPPNQLAVTSVIIFTVWYVLENKPKIPNVLMFRFRTVYCGIDAVWLLVRMINKGKGLNEVNSATHTNTPPYTQCQNWVDNSESNLLFSHTGVAQKLECFGLVYNFSSHRSLLIFSCILKYTSI